MAPAIQAKKRPVIKKGNVIVYHPETFAKYKRANFIWAKTADEILDNVKPLELLGRRFITFDTETHPYFSSSHIVPIDVVRRWVGTGKQAVPQDYLFCISICDGTNAWVLFDSVENNFNEVKKLAPLFEDPTIEKIAHNIKFDMHMLANAKMKIIGRLHDTVVAAKLADENRFSYKLEDLASKNSECTIVFEGMVRNYKQMNKVTDYRFIPKELIAQYACADVWNDIHVFVTEYLKLLEDEMGTLYDTEMEATVALYAMERHGIKIDPEYEQPLKKELQEITDAAEKAIYDEVGYTFNINSTAQLYQALVKLGVNDKWIPRTDKGNPSLNKKALDKLALLHNVSIVKKILEFRKNEKLLNTYAIGIYNQKDSIHKVHCNINQTEATTGRMSVNKPALQTLPKKDKRIRRAFLPSINHTLWFMDLDQVEYRLFAHYAQAKGLIEAIKNGHDVHSATAALIYHKTVEEIDPEGDERQRGKTINFSLIYGQGDEATAMALGCTKPEARQIKNQYFAAIPEARPFINTVHQVIKVRGYVKNFYGRRRRLSYNDAYKAPNALIQGCSADYLKRKIVLIYKFLRYNELATQMLLAVHDELVFDVASGEEKYMGNVRWLMSDFIDFRVPITAGVDKGAPSWGQKEKQDIDFEEPSDKSFLSYNLYDGHIFDI